MARAGGRLSSGAWNPRRPGWTIATLLILASSGAGSEPLGDADRWVPSFGLYFDSLGQKAAGSVTTSPVAGPPLTEGGCLDTDSGMRTGEICSSARQNPEQIIADDSGSDTSIAPLVGGTLELMTPSPFEGWLRPRLFIHGDLAASFAFERNVGGIGNPRGFALPEGTDPDGNRVEELSVVGQGSRSHVQLQTWVWSAGTGIAFNFELFDRRIRIKPSFEYLRQEVDLTGVVHRAVKLQHRDVNSTDLRDFRLLVLKRRKTRFYDGLGGGLEVEVDATRIGPFRTSFFLMGRGYKLLGDLDTELSASQEFIDSDTGETVTETATWNFELDSLVWRTGLGIRFRWLPVLD